MRPQLKQSAITKMYLHHMRRRDPASSQTGSGGLRILRALLGDNGGNVGLIAGLSLPVLMLAVGGGIDMTRAYTSRQNLANVVELSCNQSALEISHLRRQPENADRPAEDFVSVADAVSTRRLSATSMSGEIQNAISDDLLTVRGSTQSENVFAAFLGAETVPISVQRACDTDPSTTTGPAGSLLFMESFEENHTVRPDSWAVFPMWNGWITTDTGIEVNGEPELSAGEIRFGNFFAELDSWGNTSMSRIMRLPAGEYEIRYWYISRVRDSSNAAWVGAVGCGSPADVEPYRSWNDETNRFDVYVEREGNYTFAPANMVVSCVYSDHWTERRITFRVTTASDYRISWKAGGRSETYGGLVDYIRICSRRCP